MMKPLLLLALAAVTLSGFAVGVGACSAPDVPSCAPDGNCGGLANTSEPTASGTHTGTPTSTTTTPAPTTTKPSTPDAAPSDATVGTTDADEDGG